MSIQIKSLKKRGDFETVYRQGKPLFCGIIGIRILNVGAGLVRLGISVGLKFSKKAVDRNRLKRQIREIFIENKPKISQGFDAVVFVNPKACKGLSHFEPSEVRQSIEGCLKAARLIK